MRGTPHYQFWKMKDLRDNAKGRAKFPNMKPDHNELWVAEEMNGKVLEIGTRQNRIRNFPVLVNEQAFLRVINPMDIQSHIN